MECCAPGTLNDDDLLRYALDPDDLSAEARQHFAECVACSARAAEYRSFSTTLARPLYRWDCPTALQVSEYATGLLTGKERKKLEDHLKRCSRCSEEVSLSKEFLGTPQPAISPRPHLRATLLQTHHLLEAQAAVRGEPLWPRQYTLDGISLSLHLAPPSPPATELSLIGQVFRLEAAPQTLDGVEVHLLPTATSDQNAPVSTSIQGINFFLSHLAPGTYELLIALPEGNLLIENIELRQ